MGWAVVSGRPCVRQTLKVDAAIEVDAAIYGLCTCGADVACGADADRDGKLSLSQFTVNAAMSANVTAPMTR
jgi:hypothetical protein